MTELRGELLLNEPLAEYTSWRVGGPANCCYKPADVNDLVTFLQTLPAQEPLLWLGLGSNLLIRDGGVQATVILTQGRLKTITPIDEVTVRAEAGVACAQMARYCARLGLTGLEFLAGIPGTVGGALAMNAGCHGGETWECVSKVETIDRKGQIRQREPQDFEVSYRHVVGAKEEWFIAGEFRLQKGDKEQSLATIRELLERRARTQPTNEPSCGSVFFNPPGDFAARLIESCGLKGLTIGQAKVSEKHANFIVNMGNARAADIEALIEQVAKQVATTHGIQLTKEVRIIGEMRK